MRLNFRFSTFIVSTFACSAIAPLASAGCGDISAIQAPFQFAPPAVQDSLQKAADPAMRALARESGTNSASIVGLWKIQLISKGNTAHNPSIPDGAMIDFGYTQWHGDGTEILNSGGRAPATENFCLGVWTQTGFLNYELNHFALSYDATTGAMNGITNIREQVILDPGGDLITGTFTITAFDATGSKQVDQVVGTISAQRVGIDQMTP